MKSTKYGNAMPPSCMTQSWRMHWSGQRWLFSGSPVQHGGCLQLSKSKHWSLCCQRRHKVLLGTHTSNGEQNYLMAAAVKLPPSDLHEPNEESPSAKGKIEINIKILHQGEINRWVFKYAVLRQGKYLIVLVQCLRTRLWWLQNHRPETFLSLICRSIHQFHA